MDTNRNGIYGSDLSLPSGAEVEAATLHVPVGETDVSRERLYEHTHHHLSERSGMRGKLDHLKSEGLAKVQHIQHAMSDRGSAMKANVSRSVSLMKSNVSRSVGTAKASLRDGTTTKYEGVQSSMRNSPMKWAGIAAGSGLALGLLGRLVHRRNKHHGMPSLVVIERSC
jgi:hypothetical protein